MCRPKCSVRFQKTRSAALCWQVSLIFRPTIPGEDATRLRAEAAEVYRTAIRPAFQRLHSFLTERYIPGARTSVGASALPNGDAWYAWAIKVQTSTDLTAQQIHEIGLSEVKRIYGEMERVKAATGFTGSDEGLFRLPSDRPEIFFHRQG